ncbi:uncharacterized protein LOC112511541 isoform X2 [Cynara cardunculus var. scolymus]|uniref:uncharacterized protein LOC112511541 isoform X2 n=1 Tax=Cynara cardunculus var. scolymus TaxID=59895 RepID=UPI000D629D99|nr:uncharacterized protein LOC112511541 isoform X2 [Cynara cardunculus var. scolymus]
MANSMDVQPETLEENRDDDHQNPSYDIEATHDFETLARSWLSSLPADKSLNPSDVETWLQSNNSSLPDHIKLMPPSDVYQMFLSFLNDGTPSNEGLHTTIKTSSPRAQKTEEKKSLVVLPSSSVIKLQKDSPIYMVKRNEAFRKYEMSVIFIFILFFMFHRNNSRNKCNNFLFEVSEYTCKISRLHILSMGNGSLDFVEVTTSILSIFFGIFEMFDEYALASITMRLLKCCIYILGIITNITNLRWARPQNETFFLNLYTHIHIHTHRAEPSKS